MKKLSKDRLAAREKLVGRLRDAYAAIDTAITAYNEVAQEAHSFLDGIVSDCDNYAADRSDSWSDSDKGQQYEGWKSAFEDARDSFEDVEAPSEIEDNIQRLEELNDAPEEE